MMADMLKYGKGEVMPLKEIADRQMLSQRYLSQLAVSLKNAQLLKSIWGMNGGYRLARPGADITILEIIEAVDGPISVLDCVSDPESCMKRPDCDCFNLWSTLNNSIRGTLSGFTLEDLVRDDTPLEAAGVAE